MTDASPGPGWWLASDGRWYPPHLHPDVRARSDEPDAVDEPPQAVDTAPATTFTTRPAYVPEREPINWERVAAERAARRHAVDSRRRRKVVGATLASITTLGILVAVARNDGDDDRDAATTSSSSTESSTTTVTTTTEAPTTSLPAGSVSVFSLQPGTCVQNADLLSGPVKTVIEVPCDQAHTHEVYHKVTYTPPDGTYDATRISQFASEQCSQSFATYVGIPYDRSKYYFLNFAPTEESWTQKGDREVVCLLFLQGSELTGSAKGTAQ